MKGLNNDINNNNITFFEKNQSEFINVLFMFFKKYFQIKWSCFFGPWIVRGLMLYISHSSYAYNDRLSSIFF